MSPLSCWLANRRCTSFGLLAVAFGLTAPLIAATYASHLIAFPQYKFPGAADFEPYRLLLVSSLFALAIGLMVRLLAMRTASTPEGSNWTLSSQLGEAAWILLAVVVGSLALVSTWQDPDPRWPLLELSGLASWVCSVAWRLGKPGVVTWLRLLLPLVCFVGWQLRRPEVILKPCGVYCGAQCGWP